MKKLEGFLYITLETMKTVSILLQPYCPRQTKKVLDFLQTEDRGITNVLLTCEKEQYQVSLKEIKKLYLNKIEE